MEVTTEVKLTCPVCGFADVLEMPTDACAFLYECVNCNTILKPNAGDCCVFCSYADEPCIFKQIEKQSS